MYNCKSLKVFMEVESGEDYREDEKCKRGGSGPKMERLTKRVTGVFNSIKEALPNFDEDGNQQV